MPHFDSLIFRWCRCTYNTLPKTFIHTPSLLFFTCGTLKIPPQRGRGQSDAAHPVGTGQAGSGLDGRSGRWTPGHPLSSSRAECTLLHYTPECAGACGGEGGEGKAENKTCLIVYWLQVKTKKRQKGGFHTVLGWRRGKERQGAEIKNEDGIVRSEGRERKQGVLFQRVVDFRGLQRQSISNADMIQRFPVQLPMARQVL